LPGRQRDFEAYVFARRFRPREGEGAMGLEGVQFCSELHVQTHVRESHSATVQGPFERRLRSGRVVEGELHVGIFMHRGVVLLGQFDRHGAKRWEPQDVPLRSGRGIERRSYRRVRQDECLDRHGFARGEGARHAV